jgi:hypothetical protein
MNLPGLPPSRLALFAFALLCLPVAAADPTLTIVIDGKAIMRSDLEVGFPKGGPKDNAVIKIYEGTTRTGTVDITMRLSQDGTTSARLTHAGTYTLSFSGFKINCSPKLYVRLPDLGGASQMALFTANGNFSSSKITIKDLICDNNAKKYYQFPSDGSIKVTAPAK